MSAPSGHARIEPSAPSRNGRIVTFYSYKGGTGRSMQLANVAWILATNGKRVLVVDWDLEAPGLHRYFQPFLIDKQLHSSEGLIDLFWEFADAAMTPSPAVEDWHERYADFLDYVVGVDWQFSGDGRLDLLPAGRQGPRYGQRYAQRVNSFRWSNFYDRLGGGAFLESLKSRMRAEYDFVLIDSRTGVTDTAGICTVQMPDTLVLCFTPNNQSIDGCASVAQSVFEQWKATGATDAKRIIPVVMRIDTAEKDLLNARRALLRSRFQRYLALDDPHDVDDFWANVEVPYVPWYSYQEVLAPFAEEFASRTSILASAERLASLLLPSEHSRLARMSAAQQEKGRVAFQRENGQGPLDVAVLYRTEDLSLVEPILRYLAFDEGMAVWHEQALPDGSDSSAERAQALGRTRAAILCAGPTGWPDAVELELALRRRPELKVMRLVLPGAVEPSSPPPVPSLLSLDLHDGSIDTQLARLGQALRGRPSTEGTGTGAATMSVGHPQPARLGWLSWSLVGALGLSLLGVASVYAWRNLIDGPYGDSSDGGVEVDGGVQADGSAPSAIPDFDALDRQLAAAEAALDSPNAYSTALLGTMQVALELRALDGQSVPPALSSTFRRTVNKLADGGRPDLPADAGRVRVVRNYGTGFVAGYESGVVVWFGVDGQLQRSETAGGDVLDLFADPAAGELVLAATPSAIVRWSTVGGRPQASSTPLGDPASRAVFVDGGQYLVTLAGTDQAQVLRLGDQGVARANTVELPHETLLQLRTSSDGSRALILHEHRVYVIEFPTTGVAVQRTLLGQRTLSDADLHADGVRLIVVGPKFAAQVYRNGQAAGHPLSSGREVPARARYLADSVLLMRDDWVSVRSRFGNPQSVAFREPTVWPVGGGPLVTPSIDSVELAGGIPGDPQRFVVALGGGNGRVLVLSITTAEPLAAREAPSAQISVLLDTVLSEGAPVDALRLSRDGRWLAVSSERDGLRLWYLGIPGVSSTGRVHADPAAPPSPGQFLRDACAFLEASPRNDPHPELCRDTPPVHALGGRPAE